MKDILNIKGNYLREMIKKYDGIFSNKSKYLNVTDKYGNATINLKDLIKDFEKHYPEIDLNKF